MNATVPEPDPLNVTFTYLHPLIRFANKSAAVATMAAELMTNVTPRSPSQSPSDPPIMQAAKVK